MNQRILDKLVDMFRTHPLLRSMRHRPYLRNFLFGGLVFLSVYVLYHSVLPQGLGWSRLDEVPEVYLPTPEVSPEVWQDRAKSVRLAFIHAYHGYEQYALPHDEIRPISTAYIDNFNGWGVSMYDSLDTMIIMGFEKEYQRALPYIEKTEFSLPDDVYAPYFETIIRYLGGLLSAYALKKDEVLLRRADELAEKLDPVFATQSGFPLYGVNPSNQQVVGPEIGILAEMASLQVEYTMLAKFTGKKKWWDRANTVIKALASADLHRTGGMFPIRWNLTSAQPYDDHLSVGAQADSTHEYLLKQYLLTAKTDKTNLLMYLRATTNIISNLLFLSPTRHLLYVTDTSTSTYDSERRSRPSHTFEHLSCFLPGLLALGAHTLPLDNLKSLGIDLTQLGNEEQFGDAGKGYRLLSHYNLKDLHMWAAEGLAQTCWLSYADMPTGLGPDEMSMYTQGSRGGGGDDYLWMDAIEKWKSSGARGVPPGVGDKNPVIYTEQQRLRGGGRGRDYAISKSGYLLRPETLESLYLLWRTTGNTKWRERGWRIFDAIERHTRTPFGYASLRTVEVVPSVKDDAMPSYFLAETLKYLYLMFIEEDPISLDKWVFNTEAHPLPVFEWTAEEKEAFGI